MVGGNLEWNLPEQPGGNFSDGTSREWRSMATCGDTNTCDCIKYHREINKGGA